MTTRITIELTDQEVALVRVSDWHNLHRKVRAALPPEPFRLEIELPPIDDNWGEWATYAAKLTYIEDDRLSPTGAMLLTAAVAAIRSKAAQK